jgi:Tol biopolymer transport system component
MLAPGVRLGRYEIESVLGAGGMGHVYRARDTRLDRIVALKLLPEEFQERSDRRQRFQSEARLISSLNHPNICALFDVGEQDGTSFLVMEYLEGETLEDRATRGPLPASELLRYAVQIVDALDHAHQLGITHRDLKPTNVMITASGIKLLDFGLARGPAVASVSSSTASIPAERLTGEGALVGTFQYMAPEQLEGGESDARSDIFACGALLFEMATGQTAFANASQAALIASILTAQTPPISAVRPTTADPVPAGLDHIVERCLAKKPEDRWQTARDLKLELEWVAAPDRRTVSPAARRRFSRVAMLVAGLTAVVAAGAWLAIALLNRPPLATIRFVVAPPQGSTIARGVTGTRLALSPDGRHVAFIATTAGVERLWVQSLDSLTPQPLADGAESPFWSPDSRSVGFFAPGDGQLKAVPLSGGPPRVICQASVTDASVWHRNGVILFSQEGRGVFRVPADGGVATAITQIDRGRREINHVWPVWLPDGRHFVYTVTSLDDSGRRAPRAVYVRSIDTGEQDLLMHAESRVTYSPPGFLLYVEQGSLLSRSFDVRARKVVGEPIKIADELSYSRTNGNAAFSVSETGVLAYYTATAPSNLIVFDRAGQPAESRWTDQRFASTIRISPDGTGVIADVQDPRTGSSDLWIYDLARRVPIRLTTDLGNDTNPVWSGDGLQVAFSSDRAGAPDLYVKTTDGLTNERRVFSRPGPQLPNDWSTDGQFIVFEENNRETGLDLWMLPLDGSGNGRPLIQTRFQEWGARLSPDAAWVAFVSNESGTAEVYVAPVRGSAGKVRISTNGGIAPRWRRDGRELFYLAPETNTIMSVDVTTRPTFDAGPPVKLIAMRGLPASVRRPRDAPYDVSPDGRQFFIVTPPETSPASGIAVVVNWTKGIAAR